MPSQHYPVRQVARVLGSARSSYYYRARPRDETTLKAVIERVAEAWPTYGDRRITALLHRQHSQVNGKHAACLMHEIGLQGCRPTRSPRTTHSDHAYPRYPNLVQDLASVRPDHGGVGDIPTSIGVRSSYI